MWFWVDLLSENKISGSWCGNHIWIWPRLPVCLHWLACMLTCLLVCLSTFLIVWRSVHLPACILSVCLLLLACLLCLPALTCRPACQLACLSVLIILKLWFEVMPQLYSNTKRPSLCLLSTPTPRTTNLPTYQPTKQPTNLPTNLPTNQPTNQPTYLPTSLPTNLPTNQDTYQPVIWRVEPYTNNGHVYAPLFYFWRSTSPAVLSDPPLVYTCE